MTFKMILAVNFAPERQKQLKLLGLLTKAQVRFVKEEEKEETIGAILGLTDEEIEEISAMKGETKDETDVHGNVDEDDELKEVTKEAIVLCGFDKQSVNLLLDSIRRGRLKTSP